MSCWSWRVALVPLLAAPVLATTFTGFGDSITYGINSSWGEGYLTIYRYYNSWEMPAVAVENQGVPGEYTSDGLIRVPSAINATGATHLLLMEGTNDVSAGVSSNTILFNLEAMAGMADGMGVAPVLASIPPRKSYDTRDPGNAKAWSIASHLSSWAPANGYVYASVFEDFMAEPDTDGLLSDRVHPRDAGFVVMARSWHQALRPGFGGPTLTAADPNWGKAGDAVSFTLTGTGLTSGMKGYALNMLNYGGPWDFDLALTVDSSTSAAAVANTSMPRGFYDVIVAESGGPGAVLHLGYSASLNPPTITTVTPNSAPAGQSTNVTLEGTALRDGSEVYFDSTPATNFLWISNNEVTVDSPALPPGSYDIRYVCPDRAEATFPGLFFSLGTPPTVTSVTPAVGDNTVDVPIVVAGSDFETGAELSLDTTALVGAVVTSPTQIDAVVPAGFPEGVFDVTVTNPDSQSDTLPGGYESQDPPPVVTGVSPAVVEPGERTTLTVTGDLFKAGSTVYAGAVELVDVDVQGATALTAVTPQDLPQGVYDIIVTSPSGKSGSLPSGLTADDTRPPAIVLVHPEDGEVGTAEQPEVDIWLHDPGTGVDSSSISLEIDGSPVTGFTISQSPVLLEIDYRLVAPLNPSQVVSLRIYATDLDSPANVLDVNQTFTVTDATDDDGDGLPSDWETAHGLDPASDQGVHGPSGNPDEDAQDNTAEFLAGRDPTTARFFAIAPGPGETNEATTSLFTGTGFRLGQELTVHGGGYGLNVALSDITGDGAHRLLTGPGPSPNFGPQVRGWDNTLTAMTKVNFYAYATLKYGVKPWGGRIEDPTSDLILTGPGPGIVFGPQIRAFRYTTLLEAVAKVNFYAYNTLKYGVTPRAGNVDGDGFDEIVTAAPASPVFGPHIRGFDFDALQLSPIGNLSFFAFGTPRYGVEAASGEIDGDGFDEILASPGPSPVFGPQIKGFDYDGTAISATTGLNFFAFGGSYGAKIEAGDVTGDAVGEIVAGQGEDPTALARVRTFLWNGTAPGADEDFVAWDGPTYGVALGLGTPGLAP